MDPDFRPFPGPELPDNPTPFDLAVYQHDYAQLEHQVMVTAMKAKQAALAQRQQLYKAQPHEWHKKRQLRVLARQQRRLETYQAQSEQESYAFLVTEHRRLRPLLSRYLLASGEPRPSRQHVAYHIIPPKGRYLPAELAMARYNLHQFGVGINDPQNGVWLACDSPSPSDATSLRFLTMQGKGYEYWIGTLLGAVHTNKRGFLALLSDIKLRLSFGGYPRSIEELSYKGEVQ